MFEKALTFGGWPGLLLLLAGNVGGVAVWSFCVLTRRYRLALYVSIMLFPFSFYAARVWGIQASDVPDFDQRVGLTTLLLIALFLVLLATGRVKRPVRGFSRWIEGLLWVFAISLTAGQFATHDYFAATMLSIGAAWQFVALFYLLTSLIKRDSDLRALLNSVFVFSLLNIVVRVVAKGEPLIVSLSSASAGFATTFGADVGRVGSGALGPGASYACYLAMFITLAIGMYFMTRRIVYLGYVGVVFIELLNTFTRGGLMVLGFLGLLVCFKRTRRMTIKIALWIAVVIAMAWPAIQRYAEFRGFSVQVMDVGSFSLRVELTKIFLTGYRFSWWGNGILRESMFELRSWLIVPVHNAYLEILDTCGVITFSAFILLSLFFVVAAVQASVARAHASAVVSPSALLGPFALIALVQWIVFANTTSTSILASFPYEGTSVFWIVAVLPLLILKIRRRNTLVVRKASYARFGFAPIRGVSASLPATGFGELSEEVCTK